MAPDCEKILKKCRSVGSVAAKAVHARDGREGCVGGGVPGNQTFNEEKIVK